jgi:hypothetical protein
MAAPARGRLVTDKHAIRAEPVAALGPSSHPRSIGAISWMDVAPRPNELVQSQYRAPVLLQFRGHLRA